MKAAAAELLRQGAHGHHAGRGGDPRGAAAVAVELRPRAQRSRDAAPCRRRRRGCPTGKSQLVVAPDIEDRPAPQPGPRPAGRRPIGRRCPGPSTARRTSRPPRATQVILASQAAPRWIAPHFVWAVRDELATKLCGEGVESCDQLDSGGLRVTTTLDVGPPEDRREVGPGRGRRAPQGQDPSRAVAAAKALGFDPIRPWMQEPRGQGRPQRRARRARLPDRRAGRLRRLGATTTRPARKPEFQPQFDVAGAGYRQPGSAFKPFNYVTGIDDKDVHRRLDAHGRRRPTSAVATRRTTPTAWNAGRSGSARRSSSRSTSRRSRRWRSTARPRLRRWRRSSG